MAKGGGGSNTGPIPRPPVIDPSTGRAVLGARARQGAASVEPSSASAPSGSVAPVVPAASNPAAPLDPAGAPRTIAPRAVAPRAVAPPVSPPAATAPSAPRATPPPVAPASDEDLATVFEQRVKPKLKGLAKVIYLVAQPGGTRDGALVLTFPNEGHAKRASELRPEIEQILSAEAGRPARVAVQVESSGSAPATGGAPARDRPPEDEDIDLADLVDAPPETHVSGVHRIAAAFPGAELIEDQS